MKECISREAALAALKEYNKEPFHILHALTVEGVMRWYANELGYGEDADFWATAGLLHDIDFEMWPEQHCLKAPELLEKAGRKRGFLMRGAQVDTERMARILLDEFRAGKLGRFTLETVGEEMS